jgi:hypothetical protein
MPLVEKDPKGERKPLDVKLDGETLLRLKEYSRFCGAARDKIVRVALTRLFEQDEEFLACERRQGSAPAAATPPTTTATSHRRGAAEQQVQP